MRTMWTGTPSRAPKSMPWSDLPSATRVRGARSCLALGTAMPRPIPVVPSLSRVMTAAAISCSPSPGTRPASIKAVSSSFKAGAFVREVISGTTAPRRISSEAVIAWHSALTGGCCCHRPRKGALNRAPLLLQVGRVGGPGGQSHGSLTNAAPPFTGPDSGDASCCYG